ncbi:conserved hypothetical protein [Leishmania major strain Friedlin]|uniref:Uncharacterized protein n=1 Tax=Leishmania major TaxID=5664 RepID=E9ADJ3_LEIMA|nr:conserved hypothetical protein [Leishmania major strain Friedlin]CAG9576825.1 hypothetical_protein_-_conserved [Leishmania major strain Friedlin]CBZ12283.1 conserved hypothetical protein [Leishmania major strain Friedlin]|eukprot:XP_003722022.1 conserved hypothetical protein [Leishmania major strain Friedlin]
MVTSALTAVSSASGAGAGTATTESMHMVKEASLHNTWAANFNNTETLRETVSTSNGAYTAFEEELVRELNELRRAPAAYAAIVEREATIGAPYVQENDLYFCDESAAESAAVELRRHLEEQYCPVQCEVASTASSAVSRAMMQAVSPKTGMQAGQEKRRGKKALDGPPSSPALSTGVGASSTARRRSGRPSPAPQRHTTGLGAPHGGGGPSSRRCTISSDLPGGGVTVAGVSALRATPVTLRSQGLHELTLSQLRHQFRCQQRYRAALEVALRDMRASQRQAEAAQQAAWASEAEKALRKGRRLMTTNAFNVNMGASSTPLQHNNTVEPSVPSVVPHNHKKLSHTSTATSAMRTSSSSEDPVSLRRSEDMAQLRSMHEARIRRMEQKLRDVRNACKRSLAAANIVLDAVRALREAQPAPPVQRHRGLSLAAHDTAVMYYGDEERVAALQDLYAVSRATLVGLAEYPGAPTAPLPTLEQLSRRLEQCQVEEAKPKITSVSSSPGRRSRCEDGDEGDVRERSGTEVAPSWVLPLLSEEASLLANVAKNACTTYGYISGEVHGLHLQVITGSPRSLLLQMILGLLTPVLDLSNHSLPQSSGQATQRVSSPTMANSTNATRCYAGVRIEGHVYAAAGAPTGTRDAAARADLPQFQVASSQQGTGERDRADQVPAAWLSKEEAQLAAPEHKCSNSDTGAITDASHAQRAAAAAAQRLWPLLWTGAYTIGCAWQQVRGWRDVPTFAEACEERQAIQCASSGTLSSREATPPFTGEAHTVICTTLLFASGFEEYEVVRGCQHMSPAAARRVVQSTPVTVFDGGPQSASHGGSIADSVEARRAAVDVHSTLGVTLLTPTMHPMHIHASDPSCRAVCVAVRVPYTSPGFSFTHSSMCAGEDGRVCSGGCRDPSIRIVAQVTRQCELTPPHPTTCTAEVLTQRSPVDPSVWLVLVDTAATFQRHAAAFTNNDGAVLKADASPGTGATTMSATSAVVPLALHIYAKDMNDAMGEFEHVAFIRMQQYPQPREVNAGAVAIAASAAPATPAPYVLMEPEWRYLLNGLACVAASPLSTQTVTRLTATSHTAAQASVLTKVASTTPTATSVGWATLHEPLLGRDGVLLCPLSADLRESERCGDMLEALRIHHETTSSGRDGKAAAAAGRVIRVAVQLPANSNVRWWRRRLMKLRCLQEKLTDEVVAEGDEQTAASTAQSPSAACTHQDRSPESLAGGCNLPAAEPAPPSDDGHADAKATALGASNESGEAATSAASVTPILGSPRSSANPAAMDAEAGAAVEGSSSAAEVASGPPKGKGSEKKVSSDGKREAKRSPTSAAAGGSGARAQGGRRSPSNNAPSGMSKKKAQALHNDSDGAMASSTAAAAAAASTGSSLASAQARCRTLSVCTAPKLPESGALREYESMVQRAAGMTPVASRSGSVQPCLQPSLISIIGLRELCAQLHTDLQIWEAHLRRVRPILCGERDRIATEIVKKKGKEQLRLQHDHEDVVGELQVIERGVASLSQAAAAATDALRTRERTQMLRRARLVRIADELVAIESSPPRLVPKDTSDKVVAAPLPSTPPRSAAPKVTLRFFKTEGVAAGSGCKAAFAVARPPQHLSSQRAGVLDCTMREDAPKPSEREAGEVTLVPQPSSARDAASSSSPLQPLEGDGNSAADVYAATCSIPLTFAGRATLYIDDEVAVTWLV